MKDDLELAYKIAAEIVQKYGDTYLPIFERLHIEMMKQQAKQEIKDIALSIANQK